MKAFIWYLELVTGQSVISAVSAPRQRVSLCVPIIAPYSFAFQSISARFPVFTRSAVSIAPTIDPLFRRWVETMSSSSSFPSVAIKFTSREISVARGRDSRAVAIARRGNAPSSARIPFLVVTRHAGVRIAFREEASGHTADGDRFSRFVEVFARRRYPGRRCTPQSIMPPRISRFSHLRYIITDLCSLPLYARHRNHYWLRRLTLDSTQPTRSRVSRRMILF